MRAIHKTKAGSFYLGKLPIGCRQCLKGSKLVLFITGVCHEKCFYCPLSYARKGRDVVYANERPVKDDKDVLEEARMMEAEGTGITGGDPLLFSTRAIHYIKLLKKSFGGSHHIHVYVTPSLHMTKGLINKLKEAGVDEVRFHIPFNHVYRWRKIELALDKGMDVGAEVPCIPGEGFRLVRLMKYLDDVGARFLNMNELEFSESNASSLLMRGMKVKEGSSSAAQGSEEEALQLLKWASGNISLSVHYCSSKAKNIAQVRRRLLRMAKNVAKPYEEVSKEGLLAKGVLYYEEAGLEKLYKLSHILSKKYGVPSNLIYVNEGKMRIETSMDIVERLASKTAEAKLRFGVVKEYPTFDRLEVSFKPL